MNRLLIIAVIAIALLVSCANVEHTQIIYATEQCGFWGGLWHGIVLPISIFGSLLSDNIAIYAVNNNGGWYDFGFAIGVGALFTSSKKQ